MTDKGENFERRTPEPMDPTYFHKERTQNQPAPKPVEPKLAPLTKISQPTSTQEYYFAVKDKILSHIELPEDKKTKKIPSGSIKLSFHLASDGSLVSSPEVKYSSNPLLDLASINAVQKSAPFFAFPPTITKPEKEFVIEFFFE